MRHPAARASEGCLGCLPPGLTTVGDGEASPAAPAWRLPLPALDDEEGARVAAHLPPVVDAHVHLFPERVFESLWAWFEAHAWPVRYRLHARQAVAFLKSRGVTRAVALHYAHRPGMARALNRFMAEVCAEEPFVVGTATVLPGEPDAVGILEEAFALGLRGVKLHCHVQCFSPDDEALEEIYEVCARHRKPLVMHAGRQPYSPAYRVDSRVICGVDRVEHVLRNHPTLKLCVPHLGADEFGAYQRLLERFDHLWLDTTMALADFLEVRSHAALLAAHPQRMVFGTDFPNLPYAWDRELKKLDAMRLGPDALEAIAGGNALRLWGP